MASRDWFVLGARLLGLWVLYYAFANIMHLGAVMLEINPRLISEDFNNAHTQTMYNLWYVVGYFAFAAYLLFRAEHLTRWVYGEPSPQGESENGDPAD